MTSGLEGSIIYWCNRALVRRTLLDLKVKWLNAEQFDEVNWLACYQALSDVPRLFQIFACKQVMGVVDTSEMQACYILDHSKRCPSCGIAIEKRSHILSC